MNKKEKSVNNFHKFVRFYGDYCENELNRNNTDKEDPNFEDKPNVGELHKEDPNFEDKPNVGELHKEDPNFEDKPKVTFVFYKFQPSLQFYQRERTCL